MGRGRYVARALLLGAMVPALSSQAAVKLLDGRGRLEVLSAPGARGLGLLPGETLGKGTLTVGPQSHATLQTDDGATLNLDGPARVDIATASGTQVALGAGRLASSGGTRTVEVQSASGVVVSATGAQFEVALAEDGALRVAAQKGAVQLAQGAARATIAAGKELKLARGEALLSDSVAAPAPAPAPAAAPAAPAPAVAPVPTPAPVAAKAAPLANSLSVKWPKGPVPVGYTLHGQASPGAQVTANGVAAQVRKSGAFSVKLELPEGQSVIQVSASQGGAPAATDQHQVTAVAPAAEPGSAEGEAAPKVDPPRAAKPKVKQEAAGWE